MKPADSACDFRSWISGKWGMRLAIALGLVTLLVLIFGWRHLQPQVLICIALAFLGVALFAVWLMRTPSQRKTRALLDELNHVFEQMTEGRFDIPLSRATAETYPELAESLAKMSVLVSGRMRHLRSQRDQLRRVIDSLAEGVIAVDADLRIILAGGAAWKMFGLSKSTAMGRPIWELIRYRRLQEWITKALEESGPVHGEMQIHVPEERILAISVVKLTGQPAPGAVIVAHDITGIRRLEKVRQEFVANASHELKTPITSIRAYVETLLNGALDDTNNRMRFLNTIDEQSARLEAIVGDLLTLAHIEADGDKLDVLPCDVGRVVDLCVKHHQGAAERKNVTVTVLAPEEPVVVEVDKESLETLLLNLLDNAIKYTPEGETVTVGWKAEGEHAELFVRDTGIGIARKHLSRIFERFYRVDRGRSREQGGTGLGLAIVKHLVQAVGGAVHVDSQVNHGTTFTLKLPLASTSPVL